MTRVPGYSRGQQAAIIFSCMLGFALDLYDVLIMPFVMGAIRKSLDITLTQVASITSLTLIGSVIGGVAFGWVGDRIGRKTALQYTLALFALGAIASAFAWNYASLAGLRFVTGIGLGGEWGAGMVLFNEAWNKDRRGLGSAFIQGSATIAASAAAIIGVWAVARFGPALGWRVALLSGGSPIFLLVFIRFAMPESRAWQEFDAARRAGTRPIGASTRAMIGQIFGRTLLPTTIIALVWMMAYMFAYYGVVVFLPTLLMGVMHTAPEAVRSAALVSAFAGGASYIGMGWLNDRLGRRWGAMLPCLLWIICFPILFLFQGVGFGGNLLVWPFFWVYVLFGMGNSSLGVVGTWLSELYPIEIRATAVSSLYMAGRAVGSIAPLVVPVIAAHSGSLVIGMMAALPAALLFLAATLVLPETHRIAPAALARAKAL